MINNEEYDEIEMLLAETLFSDAQTSIAVRIELSSGKSAIIDFACSEAVAAVLATREIWAPALAVARVCSVDAIAGELIWCRILENFQNLRETSADIAEIAFSSNIPALAEAALAHELIANALFATRLSNGKLCAAMLSSLLSRGWLDEADALSALYCTCLSADEFHWTFSRVLEEIMSANGANTLAINAKNRLRGYISENCAAIERAPLIELWQRLERKPQKPSHERTISIGSDVIASLIEEQNQVLCKQKITHDGADFIGLAPLLTGKHPSENEIYIGIYGAPRAFAAKIPLCWLPLNSVTAIQSLHAMGLKLFAMLDTQLSVAENKIFVVQLFCDFPR